MRTMRHSKALGCLAVCGGVLGACISSTLAQPVEPLLSFTLLESGSPETTTTTAAVVTGNGTPCFQAAPLGLRRAMFQVVIDGWLPTDQLVSFERIAPFDVRPQINCPVSCGALMMPPDCSAPVCPGPPAGVCTGQLVSILETAPSGALRLRIAGIGSTVTQKERGISVYQLPQSCNPDYESDRSVGVFRFEFIPDRRISCRNLTFRIPLESILDQQVAFDASMDGMISCAAMTNDDNVQELDYNVEPLPGCDGIDFDNDGNFPDSGDIDQFLNVFSGGSCPTCNDIDFNNDCIFPDTQDIEDLLNVFGGGVCPA